MQYQNIFILTGAGISADSGVATFRDTAGLWSQFDPMALATPEAFAEHPARVHEFYNFRRTALNTVEPNAAHFAVAHLAKALAKLGGVLTLVTQNVDDLHERGGLKDVFHMHGELNKIKCAHCDHRQEWQGDLTTDHACPTCTRKGGLRPDIVWFGEMPYSLDEIYNRLAEADLFISIGTSGSVYPAAGFVSEARAKAIPCIELNLEPSDNAALFSDGVYGNAAQIVPAYMTQLIDTIATD